MEKTKQRKRREHPILYLFPTLVILGLLVAYPLVNNLINSFSEGGVFPALGNYKKLFADRYFRSDLKNTFQWLLYTVPFEMFFGLLFAILLNSKIRMKKMFRTIFIVPWVIPASVVCIIWRWIFSVRVLSAFVRLSSFSFQRFFVQGCFLQVWRQLPEESRSLYKRQRLDWKGCRNSGRRPRYRDWMNSSDRRQKKHLPVCRSSDRTLFHQAVFHNSGRTGFPRLPVYRSGHNIQRLQAQQPEPERVSRTSHKIWHRLPIAPGIWDIST